MVKALDPAAGKSNCRGFCQQEVKKSNSGRYCVRIVTFDYDKRALQLRLAAQSLELLPEINFPDLMVFQQAAASVSEKEHRIVEAGNDLEANYNRLEATDTRRCFATATLWGE